MSRILKVDASGIGILNDNKLQKGTGRLILKPAEGMNSLVCLKFKKRGEVGRKFTEENGECKGLDWMRLLGDVTPTSTKEGQEKENAYFLVMKIITLLFIPVAFLLS